MAKGKMDPTTISTIWHFMQRVCREMRETMERTATSVQAVTLHDLAYGIWDAQAQAIAIPEGFPCRLISSSFPIRAVLKKFEGRIHPGRCLHDESSLSCGSRSPARLGLHSADLL